MLKKLAWWILRKEYELIKREGQDRLRIIGEEHAIVRELDQAFYNISQCAPNWERMRPIIAEAMVGVDKRRKSESDRITNLVTKELQRGF